MLLIIIILVTPPILYIVFWLHPITKIPSPKGIGRTTADSFFISCNDVLDIVTLLLLFCVVYSSEKY